MQHYFYGYTFKIATIKTGERYEQQFTQQAYVMIDYTVHESSFTREIEVKIQSSYILLYLRLFNKLKRFNMKKKENILSINLPKY